MNENNKLALLLGYYAARLDRRGLERLGYKSFSEYFKDSAVLLNVNENSIRNMRDEFDPSFDNPRQGYDRPMSPSRKVLYDAMAARDDDELTEIVRQILDGNFDKILQEIAKIEIEDEYMLKNLKLIAESSREKYNEEFDDSDITLSEEFRHAFADYLEESGQSVSFNEGTAIITTSNQLKIYAPNQWFSMALYMKNYVSELIKYKEVFEQILTKKNFTNADTKKRYIKELKENKNSPLCEEFFNITKQYFNTVSTNEKEIEVCSEFMINFATKYDWWYGSKTIDRTDFYVSPVLNLLGVVNVTQAYIADLAFYFATSEILKDMYEKVVFGNLDNIQKEFNITGDKSVARKTGGQNLIIYGAPGTGKSRYLEDKYGLEPYTKRIVFHPEYTYFDFVGTYKPVTIYKKSDDLFFTKDGKTFKNGESYIDYTFVPGPFIDVFVKAWLDPNNMYTLLIEEINRANAAAVFGNVFQMLDRLPDGQGEYKLSPDSELRDYLYSIEGMEGYASDGICIPSNMNIVATMNSADQGVSVIDSAFKRRWNFKYLQIDIDSAVHKDEIIKYAGVECRWGVFVSALNDKMIQTQIEEDKLIGPYFIRPEELNHKYAIDKLLLYLWDDIFRHRRDYFFDNNIKKFADLTVKFETQDVLSLLDYIGEYKSELQSTDTEEYIEEAE